MSLSDLMSMLAEDLSGRSLPGIAPEIALVVTIVLLLVVRLFQRSLASSLGGLAICGSLVALLLAVLQLLNIVGVSALTDPSAGVLGGPAARLARLTSTAGAERMPGSLAVTAKSKVLDGMAEQKGLGSGPVMQGNMARPDETLVEPPTQDVALSEIPHEALDAARTETPDLVIERAEKYEHPLYGTVYRLFGYRPIQGDDEPTDLFTSPAGETTVNDLYSSATRQGMLRFDAFTIFFRMLLIFFLALVIWLTTLTGIPDPEDSPDFYTLLIGATLGMSLMASANHLIMVYIAVEMASLPSYALAGFLKGRREAGEAALKYVVFGAGASGIMLYGISLLAGKYGTAHIPTLALVISKSPGGIDGVLLLGLFLVLVGVAFKISAVPFHFWCPDVFEGAAAEVAGFLSVASKAAALGLLVRFTASLCCNDAVLRVAGHPPLERYLGSAIALLAAITATYGNLAAYAQTNLKRLLAFSTIAHAGYMMMPVAAVVAARQLDGATRSLAEESLQSLAFYLIVYLFMNLGAFATVALIRNQIRSEDLKDYGGLVRRCPFLAVAMAIFVLSLLGVPPLAGFAAKINIFLAMYRTGLYWLLIVALANTVFSAFYYVKVLRVMILDAPEAAAQGWSAAQSAVAFCSVLMVFNLGAILVWNQMDMLTQLAVPDLLGSF